MKKAKGKRENLGLKTMRWIVDTILDFGQFVKKRGNDMKKGVLGEVSIKIIFFWGGAI